MPLYEYRCQSCERTIEAIQSFSDRPLRKCESCGGKLAKLVSRSGFVLKGSGWYASDYKPQAASSLKDSKDSDGSSDTGTKADASADSKPDAADTAKPDAKPAAKPSKRGKSSASRGR